MWETHKVFQALGFTLLQPLIVQPFGVEPVGRKSPYLSASDFVSLSIIVPLKQIHLRNKQEMSRMGIGYSSQAAVWNTCIPYCVFRFEFQVHYQLPANAHSERQRKTEFFIPVENQHSSCFLTAAWPSPGCCRPLESETEN